jgi:hypothetical protein
LEFPEATLDYFQLLGFFLGAFGHILYKGKTKTSNSTKHNGRRAVMPYQGKFVHLFGDLLEVSHVVDRHERIIHKIFGDDALVSSPGHQQISKVA